ncbi:type II toxin-antitoxin system ribonuclease VapC29 [soil metagenome]
MIELLDGNVLVSLAKEDHSTHVVARRWWRARTDQPFATCPMTQGTLLRLLMFAGATCDQATDVLRAITGLPGHEFWPDELSYADVPLPGVLGHRQVTDAYLAGLARHRGGRLVTFDRGLAALHPDVVTLIDR